MHLKMKMYLVLNLMVNKMSTLTFEDIFVFEEGISYNTCDYEKINAIDGYLEKNENEIKSIFVGFIIQSEILIVSFPKKYGVNNICDEDFEKLSILLLKNRGKLLNNSKGSKNFNFPVDSYLNICDYYIRYGLYKKTEATYSRGYNKKIDWRKTFVKSDKVFNNGNLVFFPFIIQNENRFEVLLSECMRSALNIGYKKFGVFFNVGVPYQEECKIDVLKNKNFLLPFLHEQFNSNNNDKVKKLIMSIIDLIEWHSSSSNVTFVATKNFDLYWQNILSRFLNKCFYVNNVGYDFIDDGLNDNNFVPEFTHKIIEKNIQLDRDFSVRYDHLMFDNEKAYLFDSKYYKDEISELNYKQLTYNYTLKDFMFRSKGIVDPVIYNALLLPTDLDDYSKIHLDTRDSGSHFLLKDVVIKEHYFNMKKMLNWFIENE